MLSGRLPAFIFILSSFLSACLVFLIQPMAGKMLLPWLGGSPSVWVTCLVFFQILLLLGYLYTHSLTRWFPPKYQVLVHTLLLCLAFVALPVVVAPSAQRLSESLNPALGILHVLFLCVGLPFFAVSSHAPLLSHWLARSTTGEREPYALYVASNCGSLLVLLSYPWLVGHFLSLREQSRLWMILYGLLTILVVGSGVYFIRFAQTEKPRAGMEAGVTWRQRASWLFLSFVPSSLLMAVSFYVTNDIGSMPVLWLFPLSLYLLSFILAFSTTPSVVSLCRAMVYLRAPLMIAVTILLIIDATEPMFVLIGIHFAAFFIFACICHAQLFYRRPEASRLTEFYLWIALGGVLGGLFNALVAPFLFSTPLEYPLVLVLGCFVAPTFAGLSGRLWPVRVRWGVGAGICFVSLFASLRIDPPYQGVVLGCVAVMCYLCWTDRKVFACSLAAILLNALTLSSTPREMLHIERSFFGVHRVKRSGNFVELYHGSTLHGRQDPSQRCEPLSYHFQGGAVADLMEEKNVRKSPFVGVVGLGAGALSCYATGNETWTFYEIDPSVKRIAESHFSFLKNSRARDIRIVLGDARVRLNNVADGQFGILVIDAFSSDSIPSHLITREALELYLRKVSPGGYVAVHISNRYYNLSRPLGRLCSEMRLSCLIQESGALSEAELASGKDPSDWMVIAESGESLAHFRRSGQWDLPVRNLDFALWTDDFTEVLSALK